jgi:membrane peptidoglycan carboxypeptidase
MATLDYEIGENVLTCSILSPELTTWEESIAAGCPEPAAALGLELGGEEILTLFDMLGFYSPPDIRLPTKSQSPPTTITKPGLEAVGYGDLRISPLQMAAAASVFSSGGVVPSPRFVIAIENPDRGWVEIYPTIEPQQVFPASTANRVAYALSSGDIWQATALVTAIDGETLTWFVGGTMPGADTQLTVVVLLEEGNLEQGEIIGRILLEMGRY